MSKYPIYNQMLEMGDIHPADGLGKLISKTIGETLEAHTSIVKSLGGIKSVVDEVRYRERHPNYHIKNTSDF